MRDLDRVGYDLGAGEHESKQKVVPGEDEGEDSATLQRYLVRGSPKMNFLPATIEAGEVILRDGTKLTLPPARKAPSGQAVVLGLRPQHIAKAVASAAPGHVQLPSTIELVQPTGSRVQVSMPLGGISITAEFAAHEVTAPGEQVRIDIDMTRAVLIDPQTDKVI
jgi:multiple sugar transport system ATP-binding protein